MDLGRVIGTVVATRKDPKLVGAKLLVVQRIGLDGKPERGYVVAVDTVQAGVGDTVLLVGGSSARMVEEFRNSPVDAAIVGIIDRIHVDPRSKS